jgi:hypothetical protein
VTAGCRMKFCMQLVAVICLNNYYSIFCNTLYIYKKCHRSGAHDRDRWQACVNAVMNLQFP